MFVFLKCSVLLWGFPLAEEPWGTGASQGFGWAGENSGHLGLKGKIQY